MTAHNQVFNFTIPGPVKELVELNNRVAITKTGSGPDTIFSLPFMKAGARVVA